MGKATGVGALLSSRELHPGIAPRCEGVGGEGVSQEAGHGWPAVRSSVRRTRLTERPTSESPSPPARSRLGRKKLRVAQARIEYGAQPIHECVDHYDGGADYQHYAEYEGVVAIEGALYEVAADAGDAEDLFDHR